MSTPRSKMTCLSSHALLVFRVPWEGSRQIKISVLTGVIEEYDQANHLDRPERFLDCTGEGRAPGRQLLEVQGHQRRPPGHSDPLDEQNYLVYAINKLENSKDWRETKNEPSEPLDSAGARSGDKFVVSRAGEAYGEYSGGENRKSRLIVHLGRHAGRQVEEVQVRNQFRFSSSAVVLAVVLWTPTFVAAQEQSGTAAKTDTKTAKTDTKASNTKAWTMPRTPDGQPDLQGYWTTATFTPMERPAQTEPGVPDRERDPGCSSTMVFAGRFHAGWAMTTAENTQEKMFRMTRFRGKTGFGPTTEHRSLWIRRTAGFRL